MARRRTVISIEYSAKSAQDLLGRQSVRTTFKLSERSIDALSILSCQLGIKQKSLFDHLIDDISALQLLAEGYEQLDTPDQRITKTYVISRRTLDNLEKVSSAYRVPRDMLVEHSIERIIPLLFQEKEKHEKRKNLLKKMEKLVKEADEIFSTVKDTLPEEDPVFSRISSMVGAVESCYTDIEMCVDRGRKIEDF